MDPIIFLYLFLSILFSAFFSGMEIAFVSVDRLRLRLDEKGKLTSRILNLFFRSPNNFISTMLVGNNIMLVIYGILMAKVIGYFIFGLNDNSGDNFGTVLSETLISSLIILLTGEFLPKSLFKIDPSGMHSLLSTVPLNICFLPAKASLSNLFIFPTKIVLRFASHLKWGVR